MSGKVLTTLLDSYLQVTVDGFRNLPLRRFNKVLVEIILLVSVGMLFARPSYAQAPVTENKLITEKQNAISTVRRIPTVTKPQPAKRVSSGRNTTPRYQCVVYARLKTGNPSIQGTARNVQTNSTTPMVGGAVKTSEGKYGHIAVIIAIDGNDLVLSEANFVNTNYKYGGIVTEGRKLSMTSPKIKGYIN